MLLSLFACTPDDSTKLEDTSIDDSAAETDADTDTDSDTDTDTDSDSDTDTDTDTDTALPFPEGAWAPPSWMTDWASFYVEADRGWSWVEDESWALDDFSVPQVFRGPDGRFGMLVTDMRGTDTFSARYVYWSDDGHDWTDGGVLLRPEDFPYDCEDRFEHATVWREAEDTWTVIVEGTTAVSGGDSDAPRSMCAASTGDMSTWSFDTGPLFTGVSEDDRVSVPSALAYDDGDAILWYNGDMLRSTTEGPGIRTIHLENLNHTWTTRDSAPILPADAHDPHATYTDDGGVRLFARTVDESTNLASITTVKLDADLAPVGTPAVLLTSDGNCGKESAGDCIGDPTFLRTDDGVLYLYYYVVTFGDGTVDTQIRRAYAAD